MGRLELEWQKRDLKTMGYTNDDTKNSVVDLRLNILTKILVLILTFLYLSGERNTYVEIVWLTFLSLIGLMNRQLKMVLKYILLYIVLFMLTRYISMYSNFIVSFLLMSINIISFFFPIIFVVKIIINTTDTGELLMSFKKINMPITISIYSAVMLRFIPTAIDEFYAILQAAKYRNLELNKFSIIFKPLKFAKYIVLPLITTCERLIDDLATSALTRGLSISIRRSSYRKVVFTPVDIITIIIACSLLFYIKRSVT